MLRLTGTLTALVLLVGCGGDTAQPAAEDDHEHGGTAVTRWTEQTELMFEYPPMIAGQPSEPWAIHFTRLSDFSPITEGTLTLHFRAADGTVHTTRSEAPARPGIFVPEPLVPQPGSYELTLDVDGPQLQDRILVGQIEVYASADDVPHEDEAEESGIAFFKEQQWPIDFNVAVAREREIPFAIEVAGQIVPAAGRAAVVAAPVSGLAQALANLTAPSPGDRVKAGQTLVVLSPTSQDNSYAQAKAAAERLQREEERLTRLFEAEAIPEKRLVEARYDLAVAEATLEAMGGSSGDGYNFSVRAPISGVVQARPFTPGQRVEAGEILFEIVSSEVVWLRLKIPARHTSQAGGANEAIFSVEGSGRRYRAERIVSIGSTIDPESRTLPVILAVNNADGSLKIGQFAMAQLQVGGTQTGIAIPNEAIMNEDGQPVAYVQTSGEVFERRLLTLGPTDGTSTLIERGVEAGERVVTEGAYQVYLASLGTSEIGDHGHPH